MSNGTLSVGTLNVVINGTNDAPVITSGAQAGTVKEDTTLTATGTVASSNVDHGATAAYSGDATGTYGSFAIDAIAGRVDLHAGQRRPPGSGGGREPH